MTKEPTKKTKRNCRLVRRRSFLKSALPLAASLAFFPREFQGQQKRRGQSSFYVSPEGSDHNPGTIKRPFATLGRAQKAVRIVRNNSDRSITVWVRGGTYYLATPLVFTAEDSGKKGKPVTYAAYPGELPVISGGQRIIAEWKPYRDRTMVCTLPEAKNARFSFTQLFLNGKRQTRARYPNSDPSKPGVSGYINPAGADQWPHHEIYFDPRTFSKKRWANPQDGVVHSFARNYWGNVQWQFKGIDYSRNALALGTGGHQLNEIYQKADATSVGKESRFFVENVFEELDSPGEWYLNSQKGELYCIPPEGVDLAKAQIEVAVLPQVIEFRGTKDRPVHDLNISGFRIAHTESTFLANYEVPSMGDWGIYRGGAVYLEGGEDIHVERCFFDAVGGNAVFLNNHNRRVKVYGNKFTEAGESAVCLVGKSHLNANGKYSCPFCQAEHWWSWDAPRDEYSAECLIANNLIHDIGIFGKQTAGVFLSLSRNNTVSHNHIFNVPRAAICLNDGTWGGHTIEFNDIHDTVRETGDHGPFNSWGRGPFWCHKQSHGPSSHPAGDAKADAQVTTIISNNRFRDRRGWGIDLDDGSSNYHVYNNLCLGVSIKLREGDYRTVENNIFVNPANPPGFHAGYENNSDRFIRNIIVIDSKFDNPESDVNFNTGKGEGDIYKLIYPPLKGRWMKEVDYNLFINDAGQFSTSSTPRGTVDWQSGGKKISLSEWQALGYDIHSHFGDPLFVDSSKGDYRVRPESPALKLGFRNFDLKSIGLLPNFRL